MLTASTLKTALPWTNRQGRLCPFRLVVFLGLLVPAAIIAFDLAFGPVQAEPYKSSIHSSGTWAVRFLLLSLAVTPMRRILGWNRLISIRRMIGLSVLAYAFLHLGLYAAQQGWDLVKVTSEITSRIYLTIGFSALIGLAILGATSFDAAIRKLGRTWNKLHSLIYAIGAVALVHFFLQSKSDVTEPTLMAGLFVLLMSYRLAVKLGWRLDRFLVLAICAVAASAVTAGIEYAWYDLATGIPADRVFMANFNPGNSIRPAVWTAITGLIVSLVPLLLNLGRMAGFKLRFA